MQDEGKDFRYRRRVYSFYRSKGTHQINSTVGGGLDSRVRQYRNRWRQFLPDEKDNPILDLGCGSGEFLYYLQREGYENLYGVDVSLEQVNAAKELGLTNVTQEDALGFLKRYSETFQMIVAMNLIEHLSRDEMFDLLDMIVQALLPRGRLLAVVPNSLSIFGARVRYADITHEQSFTPESVVQILNHVGLEPVAILERGPIIHGVKSGLRWLSWQFIRGLIFGYHLVETADYRWRVYTQDMRIVAQKLNGA